MSRLILPMQEPFKGFSRALFSTWIYLRRFNLLFDAGEGVATSLLNRVFGIRKIFLSHGHIDHIAGLVNLVNIRNLGAGDQTAGLDIYYPKNNILIERVQNYLSLTQSELSFNLKWKPLDVEEKIELDQKRGKTFIKTFRTMHSHKQLSLGYNIVEFRRRLKAEFVGKSQEEINKAIWSSGKDNVSESFEQIIFTYGGDSRPIDHNMFKDSLLLCHESTYLHPDDDERNFQQHSILSEVMETAQKGRVKNLLLFHLSLRYSVDDVKQMIIREINKKQPDYKIIFLYGDRIFDPLDNINRRGSTSFSEDEFEANEESDDKNDLLEEDQEEKNS
ncbi:MAG: MBL fold metallo-hydrolase [Candidatus Riflebacteria bacterium]|nr:MBL fold metallo-hydrolase [Candidatus Riflebacteria bacterium]